MPNLAQMIEAVRAERARAKQELARLDDAFRALKKLAAAKSRGLRARTPKLRRKMSAAARRRIAAAQRARWAKFKKRKARRGR